MSPRYSLWPTAKSWKVENVSILKARSYEAWDSTNKSILANLKDRQNNHEMFTIACCSYLWSILLICFFNLASSYEILHKMICWCHHNNKIPSSLPSHSLIFSIYTLFQLLRNPCTNSVCYFVPWLSSRFLLRPQLFQEKLFPFFPNDMQKIYKMHVIEKKEKIIVYLYVNRVLIIGS